MSQTFSPSALAGRTALITGASSGIGAAIAAAYSACGAHLIVSARNEARLAAVAGRANAISIPADLAAPGGADEVAARALALGPIDILVNCAGAGAVKSSAKLTEAEIDAGLALNVRAPLVLAARLGAEMAKRGAGVIINVSSVVGSLGTPYQALYASTKGAIDAMTRALAAEFGPKGVRVNALAPGLVATDMWGAALQDDQFKSNAAENTALKSWASAEMIADAAVFLASDAASYITGETLIVDGGLVRTGHLVSPSALRRS